MTSLVKSILELYMKPQYLMRTDLARIQCEQGYKNPHLFVSLQDLNLGRNVRIAFSSSDCKFTESEKTEFRRRCLDFYIELISQIFKRFSFQSDFANGLKLLNFLCPQYLKEITSLEHLLECNMFKHVITDFDSLDWELRLLRNNNDLTSLFKLETMKFWEEIVKIEKADGTPAFPTLMKLVHFIFTLPHSTACVERIFSHITLNKTKTRNHLNTDTLRGILLSKSFIS